MEWPIGVWWFSIFNFWRTPMGVRRKFLLHFLCYSISYWMKFWWTPSCFNLSLISTLLLLVGGRDFSSEPECLLLVQNRPVLILDRYATGRVSDLLITLCFLQIELFFQSRYCMEILTRVVDTRLWEIRFWDFQCLRK